MRGRSSRAARELNASGSGNMPVMNWPYSSRSARVLTSQKPGRRPGKYSLNVSRLGQLGELHPLVEDRIGLPAEHLDGMPEIAQRLGQVAGVDALATDVGLSPVGEVGDLERGIRIESGR